jgi:hypothetical protein
LEFRGLLGCVDKSSFKSGKFSVTSSTFCSLLYVTSFRYSSHTVGMCHSALPLSETVHLSSFFFLFILQMALFLSDYLPITACLFCLLKYSNRPLLWFFFFHFRFCPLQFYSFNLDSVYNFYNFIDIQYQVRYCYHTFPYV